MSAETDSRTRVSRIDGSLFQRSFNCGSDNEIMTHMDSFVRTHLRHFSSQKWAAITISHPDHESSYMFYSHAGLTVSFSGTTDYYDFNDLKEGDAARIGLIIRYHPSS